MSDTKITINRPLVGVLAICCLLVAIVLLLLNPDSQMWGAAFVRVGVLLIALWIALPTKHRQAAWANVSPITFIGSLLVLVAVAARPKVGIPLLIVVAVLGFVLRPRDKKRPTVRPNRAP